MTNPFLKHFDSDKSPRAVQKEGLDWLWANWYKKKVLAMNAPCGSGKSAMAMAIARYCAEEGRIAAYITPQLLLQSQLQRDYPEINMLKGATHYPCVRLKGEVTCEEAKAHNFCKSCAYLAEECEYYRVKFACYTDPITVYNPLSYRFLIKNRKTNGEIEKIYEADTLIVDEAQSVASMLASCYDLKIWRDEFKFKTGVSASTVALVEMLKEYAESLKVSIQLIAAQAKTNKEARLEFIRKRTLLQKIGAVVRGIEKEPECFVVEELILKKYKVEQACLQVRVTRPPKFILDSFYTESKHIIIMSGTLFPTTLEDMNIKPTDYLFLDLPSPIDKARRKFIPLSTVNNSRKNANASAEVAEAVKILCGYHKEERGIVLVSYEQAKALRGALEVDPRFMFHDAKNKAQVIDAFVRGLCQPNAVAVLSGAWEGLDLKDDLARFVIIAKCLFPDLSDKVVERKMKANPIWYSLETMKTVIQGANRATRNENDFSVTYMLDTNFRTLWARCNKHLPKYFNESIVWGKMIGDFKK